MKVYIVQAKVFYQVNGIDHQVADALEPLTTVSSKTKALKAMSDYEDFYKKIGFERHSKYDQLFPVQHFAMYDNADKKVLIYYLETEVE